MVSCGAGVFSELLSKRADLVTSRFVLLECGNAAARRTYRSAVSRLRKQMEPGYHLIVPTVEDWQAAWLAYERGEAHSASPLSSATSMANSRHFRATLYKATDHL
jgi:hypothetical protein